MRSVLPNTLLLIVLVMPACVCAAGVITERIRSVENGLMPKAEPGQQVQPAGITERMVFYKVPAVSIAMINNGRIEWAKGYGVTEAGGAHPVTEDTLFQAASISKPVTALAVMQFVQKGTLNLDEDVNRTLRSWRVPENEFTRHQRVTLRRLLSHTAGLNNSGFPGYASDAQVPTLLQVLNGERPSNTAPMQVQCTPGTEDRYSGGGYVVTQQLLMDRCAKPFPDLMQELVLGPLGMRHSTFRQPIPSELAESAAVGHGADGIPLPGKWHTYPEMAAAGLWTTPSDLARMAIALRQSGIGVGKTFLSRETAKAMLTRQLPDGMGLGVGVEGEGDSEYFSHGGANEGYRCIMIMNLKKGRGFVIMTNSDSGMGLGGEIMESIARTYESLDK